MEHLFPGTGVALLSTATQKDAADKFGEWSQKISSLTIVGHYIALFLGGVDWLRFLSAAVVDRQSAQFHTSSTSFLLVF